MANGYEAVASVPPHRRGCAHDVSSWTAASYVHNVDHAKAQIRLATRTSEDLGEVNHVGT